MKERPILMSAPMVKALQAGTKTQTRRIVKKQPTWRQDILSRGLGDPCPGVLAYQEAPGVWHHYGSNNFCEKFCAYGAPGDRLWVRETCWINESDHVVAYRADGEMPEHMKGTKWKPSIFMPRWASRITLEITEVRVQRLQDISEADCLAEGIVLLNGSFTFNGGLHESRTAKDSYRALWEHINGKGSWDTNSWLWAVSFFTLDTSE